MIKLYDNGVYIVDGRDICESEAKVISVNGTCPSMEDAAKETIAYSILKAHNKSGDMKHLRLRFDSLTSHDITYVGIIQTARASGLERFPIPYVLTNCHNSLCGKYSQL